eukprot:TRINITY_DN7784_c0_g1_i2.p1 TRINITY_DN7784_c0_g1~~TRINITY_DN7784_c0_g1_i2.p1  ORF type:complete len:535 (+),score=71.90 TRINITY_DN7784_c0_g1_i2:136-1740(+)
MRASQSNNDFGRQAGARSMSQPSHSLPPVCKPSVPLSHENSKINNMSPSSPKVPLWAQRLFLAASAILLIIPFYVAAILNVDDVGLVAIPNFFILMYLEHVLLKLTNYPGRAAHYNFGDLWENCTAGIVSVLLPRLLYSSLDYCPWIDPSFIYENYAIAKLDTSNQWVFALGFFTCDLQYYLFHLFCHTLGSLWPAHSVHHSSDHYNLGVALRLSSVQGFPSIFYGFAALPFALFISPELYFRHNDYNSVWQFWVHTALVRDMGIMEGIFVTPAAHRVHHDRRFHKNFGGVLILWDRLFGTYLSERSANAPAAATSKETSVLPSSAHMPVVEEIELFGTSKPPFGYWDAGLQITEYWRWLKSLASARTVRLFVYRVFASTGYRTARARRQIKFPSKSNVRIRRQRASGTWRQTIYLATGILMNLIVLLTIELTDVNASDVQQQDEPANTTIGVIQRWRWQEHSLGIAVVAGMVSQGLLLDGAPHAKLLDTLRCSIVLLGCMADAWQLDGSLEISTVNMCLLSGTLLGLMISFFN